MDDLKALVKKWRAEAKGTAGTAYEVGRVAEKLRSADELEAALSRTAGVEYDRKLIASYLDWIVDEDMSPADARAASVIEQARLLRIAAAPTPHGGEDAPGSFVSTMTAGDDPETREPCAEIRDPEGGSDAG